MQGFGQPSDNDGFMLPVTLLYCTMLVLNAKAVLNMQKKFVNDLIQEVLMHVTAGNRAAEAQNDALKASKDQYLRLNADFENFRRRTVCPPQGCITSVLFWRLVCEGSQAAVHTTVVLTTSWNCIHVAMPELLNLR